MRVQYERLFMLDDMGMNGFQGAERNVSSAERAAALKLTLVAVSGNLTIGGPFFLSKVFSCMTTMSN